jgi:polysaccharide export outer membrane protein
MTIRHTFHQFITFTVVALSLAAAAEAQETPAAPQAPISTGAAAEADPWSSGRYRLTPSDVLELTFPQVPEFNQSLTVQPDGYVTLRAVGDLRVQGRTMPQLQQMLHEAYEPILRAPAITVVLKEFDKPFFVVAGEVKTPGKYELRGALTVTQALAVAGGFTTSAKHSQVVLFRRYSDDLLEVKEIDVKRMYARQALDEDYVLRPGDTLLVPRSLLSRLTPFIPVPGLGLYLNPLN